MRTSILFLIFIIVPSLQAEIECYKCVSPIIYDYWFAAGFDKSPTITATDDDVCETTGGTPSTCSGNCFSYTVFVSPSIYGIVRGCTTDYPQSQFKLGNFIASVPNTNFKVIYLVCDTKDCNVSPTAATYQKLKNGEALGTTDLQGSTEYPGAGIKCESSYRVNGHHKFTGSCTGDACTLTRGYISDNQTREDYVAQSCLIFNILGSRSFQYNYNNIEVYNGLTVTYSVSANTTICTTENCNEYNTAATHGNLFVTLTLICATFLFS